MALPQAPPPYLVVPTQAPAQWEAVQTGAAWSIAPAPALLVPSFKMRALVAFILYFAFFWPGLIASVVWRRQADQFKRRTGIKPPGMDALNVLFGFGIIGAVILIVGYID